MGGRSVWADRYPDIVPKSSVYRLTLNGEATDVLTDEVGEFATFAAIGAVEVCVVVGDGGAPLMAEAAIVRPISRGISVDVIGREIRFMLPEPRNAVLEIEGHPPLYLMASEPDANAPRPGDANVRYFAAGSVHYAGEIELSSGETLYIEGGAVVRGAIRALDAAGIRIAGRGILDNDYVQNVWQQRERCIVLDRCTNVTIEGITVIRPGSWMTAIYLCEDVLVSNLHELGFCGSSDGIDVVSCKRVHITDCLIENHDDCVVIKALPSNHRDRSDYSGDVGDILVERCVFGNHGGGNAMEIGFELRTDDVGNITFRDCDVLHVHVYGAAFSIHVSDRATVHDVVYEKIRVEHHYDKLIDLRVLTSMYAVDTERGHIRNVTFRDIAIAQSPANLGYTSSLIGEFDAKHRVENVLFDNIQINGKRVTNLDELDVFQRHATKVELK